MKYACSRAEWLVLNALVAFTCASVAEAQPVASSLAELSGLKAATGNVTVTDTRGQESRGTILDASDSVLWLQVGSGIRRFEAAEVRVVRVRKEDSLANGALIGAAAAAGLTSLMFLDNECRDDPACYQAVAVYAGAGALAGLGIDALIHRHVVVYRAAAAGAGGRVTVRPIVARGRKGVRLTFGF